MGCVGGKSDDKNEGDDTGNDKKVPKQPGMDSVHTGTKTNTRNQKEEWKPPPPNSEPPHMRGQHRPSANHTIQVSQYGNREESSSSDSHRAKWNARASRVYEGHVSERKLNAEQNEPRRKSAFEDSSSDDDEDESSSSFGAPHIPDVGKKKKGKKKLEVRKFGIQSNVRENVSDDDDRDRDRFKRDPRGDDRGGGGYQYGQKNRQVQSAYEQGGYNYGREERQRQERAPMSASVNEDYYGQRQEPRYGRDEAPPRRNDFEKRPIQVHSSASHEKSNRPQIMQGIQIQSYGDSTAREDSSSSSDAGTSGSPSGATNMQGISNGMAGGGFFTGVNSVSPMNSERMVGDDGTASIAGIEQAEIARRERERIRRDREAQRAKEDERRAKADEERARKERVAIQRQKARERARAEREKDTQRREERDRAREKGTECPICHESLMTSDPLQIAAHVQSCASGRSEQANQHREKRPDKHRVHHRSEDPSPRMDHEDHREHREHRPRPQRRQPSPEPSPLKDRRNEFTGRPQRGGSGGAERMQFNRPLPDKGRGGATHNPRGLKLATAASPLKVREQPQTKKKKGRPTPLVSKPGDYSAFPGFRDVRRQSVLAGKRLTVDMTPDAIKRRGEAEARANMNRNFIPNDGY